MSRFREPPATLALATECCRCHKAVTIRLDNPTPERIDEARRRAVCTSCWLARSIRHPEHRTQVRLPYKDE